MSEETGAVEWVSVEGIEEWKVTQHALHQSMAGKQQQDLHVHVSQGTGPSSKTAVSGHMIPSRAMQISKTTPVQPPQAPLESDLLVEYAWLVEALKMRGVKDTVGLVSCARVFQDQYITSLDELGIYLLSSPC
jgi:hypothetical protein